MKRHYSIADILAVDRQVVNAIMERAARVKVDGSLAIEYVVDSMPGVFMPDGDASRSVADLSSLQSRGDFRSPGGSRVSASDDMSSVSHQQSDAASFKRRLGDMERERNDLRAQLKRGAGGGGGEAAAAQLVVAVTLLRTVAAQSTWEGAMREAPKFVLSSISPMDAHCRAATSSMSATKTWVVDVHATTPSIAHCTTRGSLRLTVPSGSSQSSLMHCTVLRLKP